MRQSIIRDPGGDRIIRIVSGVQPVDGSVLIVPAGTIAYFILNGIVSEPYTPGRHIINTGVSPFFVRLHNIMTGGDPAITVSVIFISPEIVSFTNIGINDIAFNEPVFGLHLRAMGSCVLGYKISRVSAFLNRLFGMYSSFFSQEDVEPAINALVMPSIKSILSTRLSNCDISNLQNELVVIGNSITAGVSNKLLEFGIEVVSLGIQGININEDDLNRFRNLEAQKAQELVKIEVDATEMDTIYGGNIWNRILEGMLTSTVRGRGEPNNNSGGMNQMPNMAMGMAMMPMFGQMMGAFRDPINNAFNSGNMFNNMNGTTPEQHTNSRNDIPLAGRPLPRVKVQTIRPLPGSGGQSLKICRKCGAQVAISCLVCPICNTKI